MTSLSDPPKNKSHPRTNLVDDRALRPTFAFGAFTHIPSEKNVARAILYSSDIDPADLLRLRLNCHCYHQEVQHQ
jgi:hypothetical protein